MKVFHINDVVYIASLGTIDAIAGMVINQQLGAQPICNGYKMMSVDGIFSAENLTLVREGPYRQDVERFLKKRKEMQ